MSGHNYVPWRSVKTWRCVRCGKCCRIFSIPLTLGEAFNIVRKYGPVVINRKGKFILISKPNGDCIFLSRRNGLAFCDIYLERPFVCRIYPFYIRLKPLVGKGEEKKALFECDDGLKIYVYVDAVCEGINKGGYLVRDLVPQAVRIWRTRTGV